MRINTVSTNSVTDIVPIRVIPFGHLTIYGVERTTRIWYSKRLKRTLSRSKKVDKVIGIMDEKGRYSSAYHDGYDV